MVVCPRSLVICLGSYLYEFRIARERQNATHIYCAYAFYTSYIPIVRVEVYDIEFLVDTEHLRGKRRDRMRPHGT